MLLLKAAELAEKLRLPSPKAAKSLMARWGVQPYDLGRGRGMGLRWAWDEVAEALELNKRGKKRPPRQTARHKAEVDAFFAMTPKQLKEYRRKKGLTE